MLPETLTLTDWEGAHMQNAMQRCNPSVWLPTQPALKHAIHEEEAFERSLLVALPAHGIDSLWVVYDSRPQCKHPASKNGVIVLTASIERGLI